MSNAADQLAGMSVNLEDDLSFKDTSKDNYKRLQRYINVSSFSMLAELHACPRKFQLIKGRAASGGGQYSNVDFAYGHAVGAGVQSLLATGDLDIAMFNAFMAWNIAYGAEIERKKKSIWNALLAVMKYQEFHKTTMDDWIVWTLPSGKPATEVTVEVDFENGYKHYLHIDVILYNQRSGEFAIQENKTTGFTYVDEALYANSSQALSYAALLDMIQENASFEVFYMIYSTTKREWQMMPFTKPISMKAEWFNDVQLDHAAINTYVKLNFFPKRGENCFSFSKRCEFFGECNLVNHLPEWKYLPADESVETVDYSFKLSDMIARQTERIAK